MASIDLDKLDKAYDFLAENEKGHAALSDFRKALDTLHAKTEPKLSWAEFLFVARSLVQQLSIDNPSPEQNRADADMMKLQSVIHQPSGTTRLGANLSSPAVSRLVPGGFKIALVK